MSSAGVLNIALVTPLAGPQTRGIFRGLRSYQQRHAPWRLLYTDSARLSFHPLDPRRIDGLISDTVPPGVGRALRRRGVPIVLLAPSLSRPRYPAVVPDDAAIGRLAAEHFLDRGFRHFAFLGWNERAWSVLRGGGYVRALQAAGMRVHTADLPQLAGGDMWSDVARRRAAIGDWLMGLPRPLALFGAHDLITYDAAEELYLRGVTVPDDIAILGVDDWSFCELAYPPLSSIPTSDEAIGYAAGSLMDRMLRGERVPTAFVRVPPGLPVVRRSTDVMLIDDADVAEALRYIRAHARRPINVTHVAAHLAVSRRTLERRFRDLLRRSPHDQILHERMRLATSLLLAGDVPIRSVARGCGIPDPRVFRRTFHRAMGMSPIAYRHRHRAASEPPI